MSSIISIKEETSVTSDEFKDEFLPSNLAILTTFDFMEFKIGQNNEQSKEQMTTWQYTEHVKGKGDEVRPGRRAEF